MFFRQNSSTPQNHQVFIGSEMYSLNHLWGIQPKVIWGWTLFWTSYRNACFDAVDGPEIQKLHHLIVENLSFP